MDCLKFSNWLENRDTYDLSEADKALKHSASCKECSIKLQIDEQLDSLIADALKPLEMPASLRDKVDMSLDRVSEKKTKTHYGWYGALTAAVAAMLVVVFSFSLNPSMPSLDEMGRYVIEDHYHHDDSVLAVNDSSELDLLGGIANDYQKLKNYLPQSFSFIGARICPLGDCEAVHLVFNDEGKRMSVYMIKASDAGFSLSTGRQYSMQAEDQTVNFWRDGDYIYAMIG